MSKDLVLITGGAGFIGSNLAYDLLQKGHMVRILDNLSRKGAETNLGWLNKNYPKGLEFVRGDVRDSTCVQEAVQGVQVIYHFASQAAVTTSILDPQSDFEINVMGTFNVLEAARLRGDRPIVLFTSTNKVYGEMTDLVIEEKDTRYQFRDYPQGISEDRSLDFHSPYGCSKGAADQYMHDYARIYDLPTVVFRMSCIYGKRQFGIEDQGWVAHFTIAAALNRPLTIYGNGKQVRDILWIDDLVRAFQLVVENIDSTSGQVYNVGGGQTNTISIWAEFGEMLSQLSGHQLSVNYKDSRPGDQLIYVSDTTKLRKAVGWKPLVGKEEGIQRLYRWVLENKKAFV